MKAKLILLACFIFFTACDDAVEEEQDATASLITGKWQLTESNISSGGAQYWNPVENGETIVFSRNGEFTSDRYDACNKGTFTLKDNSLSLRYACSDFNPIAENEEGLITYSIEQFSDYCILTPTSGPTCVEGCSYKYIRVE